MQIFLSGCTLFGLAFLIHVLLWKIRLPRRHTSALLIVFAVVLLSWLTLGGVVLSMPFWERMRVALFYGATSLCYVITYSAIEGDSPTLSLMRFVAASGPEGISAQEIAGFLAERPFIRARLAALSHSSLIKEENGRYFIAGKPSGAFRLVLGFRRIYGAIPKGG